MFGYYSEKTLKEELEQVWKRVVALEEENYANKIKISELENKAPENEKDAYRAAQSARVHKGHIVKIKTDVQRELDEITQIRESIREANENIQSFKSYADNFLDDLGEKTREATSDANDIRGLQNKITTSVQELNELVDANETLDSKVDVTNELIERAESNEARISNILKTVVTNNAKIKSIYEDIHGYENEDEDGESIRVEGLKDKLEKSYDAIQADLKITEENVLELTELTSKKCQSISEDSHERYLNFLSECSEKFDSTHSEIQKLLPAAMTAGLSAAYDEKKKVEEQSLEKYQNDFQKYIKWLLGISLIPFAIDAYLFLVLSKDIVQVIYDTPKLLLSILPIYFPVLWIAYSSNKKINLSKRLIEEYTHKGVLSKTYEGLSKQISDLQQDEDTTELRTKLLYNLLEVNSENPGKLISNYDMSDHPVMDALDKSAKLSDSIDRLKDIPGFAALAKKLEVKKQQVLNEADVKVSEILNMEGEKENSESKVS